MAYPKCLRLVAALGLAALGVCPLSCAKELETAEPDWAAQRNAMVDMLVARWELQEQRVIAAMRKTLGTCSSRRKSDRMPMWTRRCRLGTSRPYQRLR